MAVTQQGAEGVAGRAGTPRMTEAVGTGRALAQDRRRNPHAKDLHPFQVITSTEGTDLAEVLGSHGPEGPAKPCFPKSGGCHSSGALEKLRSLLSGPKEGYPREKDEVSQT